MDVRTVTLPSGCDTVEFAPDGKTLAVGGGSLLLVDAASGKATTLRPKGSPVRTLRFAPDGRRLAASFIDRTVKVWDLPGKKPPRSFAASGAKVGIASGLAFSPDGARLVTGDAGFQVLRVWDVANASEVGLVKCGKSVAWNVAVLPDGKRAVSAGAGKSLCIWSLADGTELKNIDGHTKAIECLAVSKDGKRAVTGSQDATARVWELKTGAEKARFLGHAKEVVCVALSPDGKLAASGGWDGPARLWSTKTGKEVASVPVDSRRLAALAFSPDGRTLAICGSHDSKLWLWTLPG